jgi:hypothetical protein
MSVSERVTVSLRTRDLEFLTRYEADHGLASRSAAVQAAVAALRARVLMEQYEAADAEWYGSGEAAVWDRSTADGLDDE